MVANANDDEYEENNVGDGDDGDDLFVVVGDGGIYGDRV